MSQIERGNYSEHDLAPEEFREKLEGKAGRILDKIDREITITSIDADEPEKVEGHGFLRYAKGEDIEGVVNASLDRKKFREKNHGIEYNEEFLKKDTGELRQLFTEGLQEDAKSSCLVLDINGEIAGYVEFGKDLFEKDPKLKDITSRIFTISVLEKYFRNGFGEVLLEKAILEAEKYFDAERIVLGTQAENKGALLLYVKKFGFRKLKPNSENKKRKWKKKREDGEWEDIKNYDVSLVLDIKKWKQAWEAVKN